MLSKEEWSNTVLRNVYVERINVLITVLKECKENGEEFPDKIYQEYKSLELLLNNWSYYEI